MKMASSDGRKTRPDLKIGICGEHGGDPASIHFCHQIGIDYVSARARRVPIARLAAAQARLMESTAPNPESRPPPPGALRRIAGVCERSILQPVSWRKLQSCTSHGSSSIRPACPRNRPVAYASLREYLAESCARFGGAAGVHCMGARSPSAELDAPVARFRRLAAEGRPAARGRRASRS